MSPRDLAFVGCRLLALYVLLGVVQAQTSNLFFYLQSLNVSEAMGTVQNFDFDPYFQAALLNLGIFLLLWFRASWIAGRVAAGTIGRPGEAPATWSRQSAVAVVVIAIGLWILVLLVPSLAYVLQGLFRSGYVDPISLIYVILAVTVGLICIFSPRGIAGFIDRTRRW